MSVKSSKQAMLNLQGMADKTRLDITEEEVKDFIKDIPLVDPENESAPSMVWGEQTEKPHLLDTTIDQIKALFNVGNEVVGWTVSYYAPPKFISGKGGKQDYPKFKELAINPVKSGLAGRFIVVVGSREVPSLQVAVGSSGAESQYLMLSGDCLYLKITICPIIATVFNNRHSEMYNSNKNSRAMPIKKNLKTRHVFVFDAHVNITSLANKVKDEFISITSDKPVSSSDVDIVASMANSDGSKIPEESKPEESENTEKVSKRQNSELSGEL